MLYFNSTNGYLMVNSAWKRAVAKQLNEPQDSLFLSPYNVVIDEFFSEQNLTLSPNTTWRNVKANIFSVVDGKKLLFSNSDSLFHKVKSIDNRRLIINRQTVAASMLESELHQDIIDFFDFLRNTVKQ